ncbi:MAG: FAD:protein FMN transferase [Gammaproteobacteria bacterium]|jgi:thiamine biosynthesis lipoprotein|nr:FAD:protein FMN transferase [Gammaproteobacteria bacterium]
MAAADRLRGYDASMHRRNVNVSLLVASVALLLAGCGSADTTLIRGSTMGTTYSLRLRDCPAPRCADAVREQVEARLQALNSALSHYDDQSALSRFNQSAAEAWVAVPADLAFVAGAALDIARLTGGAFDPTIAPAVNLWGFGSTGSAATLAAAPAPPAVAAARQAVGYAQLRARLTPPGLQKTSADVQLDLSGIAKGYAVDQLSLLLESIGITDYIVEIGGEVRTAGRQPTGAGWRIAIEPPADDMAIEYIVVPGDAAVASSGDYRNYYELGDRRVSHTLDPLTATPVDHDLAAVSVIAQTAMQADGLATALLVMGPERGPPFALEQGLAALFFVRGEAGISARMTPAFADYLLSD